MMVNECRYIIMVVPTPIIWFSNKTQILSLT